MPNFHFILDEPAVPGNIGATARAVKVMGFGSLRLVNPENHLAEEAKWLAHGSIDILEKAKLFNSVADATKDLHFVVGTTAKKRRVKFDYYPVDEGIKIIKGKANSISEIGILFGGEESGLSNDALAMCDIITFLPMKTSYPSLNLSQAVMVYAYLLYTNFFIENMEESTPSVSEINYQMVKKKVSTTLEKIGMEKGSNIHSRILERIAVMEQNDLHLLLSVLNKLPR